MLAFKAGAMEVNKLNSLMKTMANKAGLDEKRRLTNHSARKTMKKKNLTIAAIFPPLTSCSFQFNVLCKV